MSGAAVKLYCAWFCPFAQRAWIALVHKGVDFEYVEVDPYDKNPAWLALHPDGLVPVIQHGSRVVYESPVCVEYVDEVWPDGTPLLPRDPYSRAQVRMMSDFISKCIVPHFYALLLRRGEAERREAADALTTGLRRLFTRAGSDSAFLVGDSLSLADIMLAPHVQRFYILHEYRGFQVPDTAEFARFQAWRSAVTSIPAVNSTLAERQKLLEKYRRYEDDTAETIVADAIRKGTQLP